MAATEPGAVGRGYIVGATPRTGSNYLCHLLRRTAALGMPYEYLSAERLSENELTQRRGSQLWAAVRELSSTPNGVYGLKVFPYHLAALDDPFVTAAVMQLPVFHMSRLDVLGQAISHARALQTSQWRAEGKALEVPLYDRELITDCLHGLQAVDATMRVNYTLHGADVTYLVYEDWIGDPAGTVQLIADRMKVPGIEVDLTKVPAIQRDDLNEQWRARYVAELGDSGRGWHVRPPRPMPSLAGRVRRKTRTTLRRYADQRRQRRDR